MSQEFPSDRIERLQETANKRYYSASTGLGFAALYGFFAGISEGGYRVFNITLTAALGVTSLSKALEGWRQHRQADRLEVILAQDQVQQNFLIPAGEQDSN